MITTDRIATGAPMAIPSLRSSWEEVDGSEEMTVADGSAELDSDNAGTSAEIVVLTEDVSISRCWNYISNALDSNVLVTYESWRETARVVYQRPLSIRLKK